MHQGHEFALMLRKAYLTFHRRVNARVHRSEVTADQFVVLTELLREEGIAQVTIVERTGSDPNTIAALLRLLERRGLVRREVHAQDARARCVFLTPEGRPDATPGWRLRVRTTARVALGYPRRRQQVQAARWPPANSRALRQVCRPIGLEERSDILSGDLPVDAALAFLYVHVLVRPRSVAVAENDERAIPVEA